MGNQQGILEFAYHNRIVSRRLIQALDIGAMTDSAPTGQWNVGEYWWWWHASRVIHDRDLAGNTVEVIDEFPNFSFILGDMHPHVLALPFVIMAIGLAPNLMLSAAQSAGQETAGTAGRFPSVGLVSRLATRSFPWAAWACCSSRPGVGRPQLSQHLGISPSTWR
ncbi:MAG: hypothetical protein IPH87_27455 [Anaerolineae bacterium]|nr:hypothetical protein [Anaerolineae bacterium]